MGMKVNYKAVNGELLTVENKTKIYARLITYKILLLSTHTKNKRLAIIPIKTTHPCRVLTVAIQPLEFQSQIQARECVLIKQNCEPRD